MKPETVEGLASSITRQLFTDSADQEIEHLPEIVFKRAYLSESTLPELFTEEEDAYGFITQFLSAEKVLDFYQKTQ